MNAFLLLTYHAWRTPRQTFHQLLEQINLRTTIVLYTFTTFLYTATSFFAYPEQSFFDVFWLLIVSAIAPLMTSEFTHRFTKQSRITLIHGILLIETSTDLLFIPADFLYVFNLDTDSLIFFSFFASVLGGVLAIWSFIVLVLMLSELFEKGKLTSFFLFLSPSLLLLPARFLLEQI